MAIPTHPIVITPPSWAAQLSWLRPLACFKTPSWIAGSSPVRHACHPSPFPRLPCSGGLCSLIPISLITSSLCECTTPHLPLALNTSHRPRVACHPCPSKKTHFTPKINSTSYIGPPCLRPRPPDRNLSGPVSRDQGHHPEFPERLAISIPTHAQEPPPEAAARRRDRIMDHRCQHHIHGEDATQQLQHG